jgi:hypothetical protein
VVCIIRRHMGSIFLKVIPVDPDNPRYLVLKSRKNNPLVVNQRRGGRRDERVEPDEARPFAWDEARPFAWDDPDDSQSKSIWEGDEERSREAGVETINFKVAGGYVAGQDGSLYTGKLLWETSVTRRHNRLLE